MPIVSEPVPAIANVPFGKIAVTSTPAKVMGAALGVKVEEPAIIRGAEAEASGNAVPVRVAVTVVDSMTSVKVIIASALDVEVGWVVCQKRVLSKRTGRRLNLTYRCQALTLRGERDATPSCRGCSGDVRNRYESSVCKSLDVTRTRCKIEKADKII